MRTLKQSDYSTGRANIYSSQYYHTPSALFYTSPDGCEHLQLAILSAGTNDSVQLFEQGGLIYIYSANLGLEYMAIEEYNPGGGEALNTPAELPGVYLDGEGYRELERLRPINRAKRMMEYLPL